MKRFAIVAACAASLALAGLAGCSTSPSVSSDDTSSKPEKKPQVDPDDPTGGMLSNLLGVDSDWKENALGPLPALPQSESQLLPFEVSNNTRLAYAVDAKSITTGSDGVIRYTVVITSPAGARNVNYEGIRCSSYEWRLYASLNANHDGWDRTVQTDWAKIQNGALNQYRSALSNDYFCPYRMPVKAREIVENMRYKRTASSQMR